MPTRTLTRVTRAALSRPDRETLIAAANALPAVPDDQTLLDHARALCLQDLALWGELRALALESESTGAFALSGFPVDVTDADTKQGHLTELALLAVASVLGTPIGYASQRGGRLVHDLRPIREHADEQLGTGSVELIWHTEEAHTVLAPRFVALLCVRGDDQAGTLVSCARPANLPADVRARLATDDFVVGSDASYDGSLSRRCAVLGAQRLTFDPLFTQCADEDAQHAMNALRQQIDEDAQEVVLRAGDLLVVNNFVAAHARTAYAPRYDGTDRWLQRTVVLGAAPPASALDASRPNVVAS